MDRWTCRIDEVGIDDLARVGGKGASLGELRAAGAPVPRAFCVTTDAYRHVVEEGRLADAVAQLLAAIDFDDLSSIDGQAQQIRDLFGQEAMPVGIRTAIETAYAELAGVDGDLSVSVRSSATAEDLPGTSFAGQQDTYLHIRGAAAVVEAVQRCWASLWTARAIAYRHAQGFDREEVLLAVVVQEMFASQVSGVLFTANPITSNPFELVVNASWGLGEAVVSGHVNPDQLTVSSSLEVTARHIADKEVMTVPDPSGHGVATVPVPPDLVSRQSLPDDAAVELCRIGQTIEQHYGFPQDVEWGWADGRFAILQSREITGADLDFGHELETWKSPAALADMYDERWVWSRAYSDEVQTGPSTPSFYTYLQRGMTVIKVRAMELAGVEEVLGYPAACFADIPYFRWYGARAYYNLAFERERIRRFIPPFARDEAALWPFPAGERDEIRSMPFDWQEFTTVLWRLHTENHDVSLLGTTAVVYENLERWTDEEETFWQGFDLASASVDEIFAAQTASRAGSRFGDNVSLPFTIYLFMLPQALSYLCAQWLGDDGTLSGRLVTGIATKTSEENQELWELSRLLRANPDLIALAADADDEDVLDAMRRLPDGDPLRVRFDEFLAAHGHRGGAERDAVHLRWRDQPSLVLRAIRPMLALDDDVSPARHEAETIAAMTRARDEARARLQAQPLGSLQAPFFDWLVDLVRDYTYYRDFERFFNDKTMSRSRSLYEAIGRRLVRHGLLDDADDVFFLGRQEMSAADNGQLTARQVAIRVRSRRAVYEKYAHREPPKYIRGWTFFDDDSLSDGGLHGIGASGGVVTGRARVCRDLSQVAALQKGDILVTVATDPGWTSVFPLLGGLVVETGGVVAHAVMISREYGLPCVSNLSRACELIPDGGVVTIDGRTGQVHVHESAASPNPVGDDGVFTADARQHDFAAPADVVWRLIEDIGAIGDWWPGGFESVEVGSAPDGRPTRTMVRHGGSAVVETFHSLEPESRSLLLSVDVGMPEAIRGYTCRYEVIADGPDRCRLEWRPAARVDADGAGTFAAVVDGGWAKVVGGLTDALGRLPEPSAPPA